LTKDTSTNGCATVPVLGETLNHPEPERVIGVAVPVIEPEPELKIAKLCGITLPPCDTPVKVNPVCERTIC
jgi:hypothetical protein